MAKEDLIRNNINKKYTMTQSEVQQALIDNFIGLQKVMTNLSVKFDELSTNMSKLLQLFEISAKTFAERYSSQEILPGGGTDPELVNKLNALLEQNKVISKGIMLVEEKLREKNDPFESQNRPPQPYPYPMQGYPVMQPIMLPSMQQQVQQQEQPPAPQPNPYKKEIGARQENRPLPKR